MKKKEKSFFVDNLSEELKNATSIVLVDYTGLSVKKQQEMKKLLKEIGAKMFVTKNTLFKISKLPSREVLYSQVVGSIASPIFGLLGTLQGNLQKLVYLLSVKAQNSNDQNPTQI